MDKLVIENLPEVKMASQVLKRLTKQGLIEPVIAGGWVRGLLMGVLDGDLDVSYVGPISHRRARAILRQVVAESGAEELEWDFDGIWNAQEAYGVERSVDNILRYYVESISSVYLAEDGHLYDPTGYGFADAKLKVLRLNQFELQRSPRSTKNTVNMALEAIRRLYRYRWQPTMDTEEFIRDATGYWNQLSIVDQEYFLKRNGKKYSDNDLIQASVIFNRYGWDDFAEASLTRRSVTSGDGDSANSANGSTSHSWP